MAVTSAPPAAAQAAPQVTAFRSTARSRWNLVSDIDRLLKRLAGCWTKNFV
jgi:hypothetical protein